MRLIYLLLILTIPFKVSAQIQPSVEQYQEGVNLAKNGGFEQGRANWSLSAGTWDIDAADKLYGNYAGCVDLSAQTLNISLSAPTVGFTGAQGVVKAFAKTDINGVQVCSIVDSVETGCYSVVASTAYGKPHMIPVIMGSANLGIRFKTSGNVTGRICLDGVEIKQKELTAEVSQAKFVGRVTMVGCATWAVGGTTFATPTTTGCSYITTGDVSAPLTNTYGFRLLNAEPGTYKIISNGASLRQDGSSQGASARWTDGTSFVAAGEVFGATSGQMNAPFPLVATFDYSSGLTNPISINMQLRATASGTGRIEPNVYGQPIYIDVYYYPPKSKVYSGATIYPHAQLFGTVSYVGVNLCTWDLTNTAFTNYSADTDCNNPTSTGRINAPSTKIPAFVLPAGSPAGTYKIIARSGFGGGASGGRDQSFRFSDGTNVTTAGEIYQSNSIPLYPEISGQITYSNTISVNTTIQIQGRASSGAAQINASNSIWGLFFEIYYFPPQDNPIIGTFEGIEKCEDDFECTDTFSAKVSSTGVVSDENLDWINGNCVVSATSLYTCTYNSGINTQSLNCTATVETAGATARTAQIESNSSSAIGIRIREGGTAVAQSFHINCQKTGSDYKPKTAKAATTNEMMYVPNVTRPKTCYYAFGGASATLASPTVCAASPCVEMYDSCSAGTPPIRTNIGNYQDITFANGTWKANTFLDCRCEAYLLTTNAERECSTTFQTGDNTITTNSSGGAVVNYFTHTSAGSSSDTYAKITCTADAP